MSGNLASPLLVLPLHPGGSNISSTFPTSSAETIDPKLSNIIGAGFQDYEASILKKLEKVPFNFWQIFDFSLFFSRLSCIKMLFNL